MTADPNEPDPTTVPDADEVEQLVFECLEADNIDAAVAELRRAHPELESRVQSVLQTLEAQGLLPQKPTLEHVPERLGPFRLGRQLGAGGMGVVYLAEQDGLGRTVALKLIRPEQLYFPGSRERFQREVEAAARLQHPGIVSVFTVGEENGMPFFTMEYVPGRSLAGVLREIAKQDATALSGASLRAVVRDAGDPSDSGSGTGTGGTRAIFELSWIDACIDLCIQVAEALQHAHQRGVLHRDVKPSNILITPDGRARLLDFGLARTEGGQQLTKSTSQIGSLPYMPPEQLDEKTSIPSVRHDVYSLGVTMFEMLARQSPFLGKNAEETRRRILEGKPASLRQTDPNASWDVETVCLTAMDPDPVQRYASMDDLLVDLENLRQRRPILARRPSAWIRLRRWEQRHPTATAVAIVAVVLIAVGGLLFGFFEQSARHEADKLTKEAERRATEANKVSDFLVDLFEFASPEKSLGKDLPVRLLLQQGADRVETDLRDQPIVCARILMTFGRVYSWLRDYDRAEDFFRRAFAIWAPRHPPDDDTTLDLRTAIGRELSNRGQYDAAKKQLDAVVADMQDLPEGHPLLINTLTTQAQLLRFVGEAPRAEAILRKVVGWQRASRQRQDLLSRSLQNLAGLLRDEYRYREAQVLYEEVGQLQKDLYPQGHPRVVHALHGAARNLAALGRFDEARTLVAAAVRESKRIFGADHPMSATVMSGVAYVHREAGDVRASMQALEKVQEIGERFGGVSQQFYARTTNDLALGHLDLGNYGTARDLFRRALAASRKALRGDHVLTAFVQINLANAEAELSELVAAEQSARAGVAMITRLEETVRSRVSALSSLAWVLILKGTPASAKEARTLAERAIRIGDEDPTATWEVGRAHALLALLNNQKGDGPAADRYAREALQRYGMVRKGDHQYKAIVLYNLAWSLVNQKKLSEAEKTFKESIAMYRRMGQNFPGIAWPLNHYGFVLMRERPAEAVPLLKEALQIRERILPKHSRWLIITQLNLAMAYLAQRNYSEAEPLLLTVHEGVLATMGGPNSAAGKASAARVVRMYEAWGKPEKAAQYRARK